MSYLFTHSARPTDKHANTLCLDGEFVQKSFNLAFNRRFKIAKKWSYVMFLLTKVIVLELFILKNVQMCSSQRSFIGLLKYDICGDTVQKSGDLALIKRADIAKNWS